MNKTLKFVHHYVSSVLKNKKGITTRLFDDKDITVGNEVDFLDAETNEKFATAKITKVEQTTFADAMKEAADIQEMYNQYEDYYKQEVKADTPMKIIHFELIH